MSVTQSKVNHERADQDPPSLRGLTIILGRILDLPDELRQRFILTWRAYFKEMRKPEAERKARMRAGADQAIAEEPSAVFPDLPDDVVIPPLGDQQQGLMLLDLDDEMQWLPRRFQEQLIESAMDWDDPALAVMDPESRRRNLFAELSGWHASLTQ